MLLSIPSIPTVRPFLEKCVFKACTLWWLILWEKWVWLCILCTLCVSIPCWYVGFLQLYAHYSTMSRGRTPVPDNPSSNQVGAKYCKGYCHAVVPSCVSSVVPFCMSCVVPLSIVTLSFITHQAFQHIPNELEVHVAERDCHACAWLVRIKHCWCL